MRHFAVLALFFTGISLSAQEVPKPPQIPFHVVEDFLKPSSGEVRVHC
jgi:hypothetical protein